MAESIQDRKLWQALVCFFFFFCCKYTRCKPTFLYTCNLLRLSALFSQTFLLLMHSLNQLSLFVPSLTFSYFIFFHTSHPSALNVLMHVCMRPVMWTVTHRSYCSFTLKVDEVVLSFLLFLFHILPQWAISPSTPNDVYRPGVLYLTDTAAAIHVCIWETLSLSVIHGFAPSHPIFLSHKRVCRTTEEMAQGCSYVARIAVVAHKVLTIGSWYRPSTHFCCLPGSLWHQAKPSRQPSL